ncbi:AAA domain-containing protein [Myroides pelagicus]|uniref:AAA family ATPase n=1 Tax=Myroides pelagicus TaxID=270914 RepID=A0A7K1GIZ8_9FLAO|nr:AAA domain-containing protein [Myroides pelagicus]MTH28778.1 AAA family ATPase [Myroides pelagicus]
MVNQDAVGFYFSSLLDVVSTKDSVSIRLKYHRLRYLLDQISKEVVRDEKIVFSNLFSRLSYICAKYKLSVEIHEFRIIENELSKYSDKELTVWFLTYWQDVNLFISGVFGVLVPVSNTQWYPVVQERRSFAVKIYQQYEEKIKVSLMGRVGDSLSCLRLDTNETIEVQVLKNGFSKPFPTLDVCPIPSTLYLVNVFLGEDNIYYPSLVILEPDYLIDVTGVAECNQDFGSSPLLFLKSKIEPVSNTKYLLIGNFANLVMDEMLNGQEHTNELVFIELFHRHFENYPFEHLFCKDISEGDAFIDYQSTCEMHFNHIKKVIDEGFGFYGLKDKDHIALEPAFLNNVFGLQGRLDVLYDNPEARNFLILELKSGSTAYPDSGTNIKTNHNTQLFLYYLLIGQALGISFDELGDQSILKGYILYSKLAINNLRSDQITILRLQEICELRNRILLNELLIQKGDLEEVRSLFGKLTIDNILDKHTNDKFKRLYDSQLKGLIDPIFQSSVLQQAYFFSFFSFIAREQNFSKIGDSAREGNQSLSSLWNKSIEDKRDAFSIFSNLEILQNDVDTELKRIIFKRDTIDNSFASFRIGDSCVLYPQLNPTDTAVDYRIYKGVIKAIDNDAIEFSLRYRQNNKHYFMRYDRWAIEKDFMDSSFGSMYKGLYSFMNSPNERKDLLLNMRAPKQGASYGYHKSHLSEEQNRILNNILSAEDYFILNGPPGTGKTSHIIKELIEELYFHSTANVLVISYTNRAVDELSAAVLDAVSRAPKRPSDLAFLRIGNEHSCASEFQPYLLKQIIKRQKERLRQANKRFSRKHLHNVLSNQRIYLSTVASIVGQQELLAMKNFDLVIVDEASQILEPQIIGLLARSMKFVMIGDHKQLPAIVLQNEESAKTSLSQLHEINLFTHRNSLFERLYDYCKNNRIHYACDTLTYQGRMHKKIAEFPNKEFYNGILSEAVHLPNLSLEAKGALSRQIADLDLNYYDTSQLDRLLATKRMFFIDIENTTELFYAKANVGEAELVVRIIEHIISLYALNGRTIDVAKQVGVITPFKNQIALIKQKLEVSSIVNAVNIVVDTVERFQGGQRDFMLYSLAVSKPYQLEGIVSMNEDKTVDRKLNVALTRAKEQMIIIGNAEVLSYNPVYQKLIDYLVSVHSYQQYDCL